MRTIRGIDLPVPVDEEITLVSNVHRIGRGWGTSGVRRSPAFIAAGWTADLPGRVRAPTLVIRGALDDQAPEQATRALYDALGGVKAYVTVSCGSHELVYEQHHTQLLQASARWLRFGTYDRSVKPSSPRGKLGGWSRE